jgi:hypothetical protein
MASSLFLRRMMQRSDAWNESNLERKREREREREERGVQSAAGKKWRRRRL